MNAIPFQGFAFFTLTRNGEPVAFENKFHGSRRSVRKQNGNFFKEMVVDVVVQRTPFGIDA